MHYLYILYSVSSDIYYVGITNNPAKRLSEHNEGVHCTFTSKHRPWEIRAVFEVGESLGKAMVIEKFIKKNRSTRMMKLLCDKDFIPDGKLSGMRRVIEY